MLPGEAVTITLRAHYTTDNFEYGWSEADGLRGSETCGMPHRGDDAGVGAGRTDRRQLTCASSRSTRARMSTQQSPKTKTDFKGNVLPHDPGVTYYGPGFVDYPDRAGNYATCHTPAAAKLKTRPTAAGRMSHFVYGGTRD